MLARSSTKLQRLDESVNGSLVTSLYKFALGAFEFAIGCAMFLLFFRAFLWVMGLIDSFWSNSNETEE